MKAKEVVLALDQGSGSSRALAFDAKGRVSARARFPIRARYPKPGWVEHDAGEILGTSERALDAVLSGVGRGVKVAGLGLASQRSTVVLWDAGTGEPLCRAPSWQDGRAAAIVEPLQGLRRDAHERTGLYLTAYYSAPKIRWLLDNVAAARRALDAGRLRAGPVSTYLLWKLTRGAVFAADPSMAQRMMLFSLRTLDWDEDMLKLFGIPREILPAILPSSGDWGVIERRGRRIPVRAMLGDQQAAALGLGAESPGSGVLNYGTGAFFLLNTGAEQHRVPGLLTSVAWQRRGEPCRYFEEGTVHAVATSFDWLRENLGLLQDVAQVDALCRRSKQRVLALQAIGGLGAPRWDYSTFTTYLGMNSLTRREDVVRGVAEGAGFLIADIVAAVRGAGLGIGPIRASGGLSRLNYLMQFQADLLQAPILRVDEPEATARGVASLAAEASGADGARSLRSVSGGREFKPAMPADLAARLHQGWRLFVEAQQKLSLELRRLGVLP